MTKRRPVWAYRYGSRSRFSATAATALPPLSSSDHLTDPKKRTTTDQSSTFPRPRPRQPPTPSPSPSSTNRDFSSLPDDILARIASTLSHPHLISASLACRSWHTALRPLREAMVYLKMGKRYKHGRGGVVRPDAEKALDAFLNGARRGSTMAMVDAGLLCWETGRKDEGVEWYRRAAEIGDPAGQFNLGIALLQAEPPKAEDAIKWLMESANAGYVRAQYQLALCFRQGRGLSRNLTQAARWYLRAAEGGYARAMYNVSLCYSGGEGFDVDHRQAKKWMKRAAAHGHSKALFEHGLTLFIDGEMMKSVVYLELAIRAGETAALHVKNAVVQQISEASLRQAIFLADNWRFLPSSR